MLQNYLGMVVVLDPAGDIYIIVPDSVDVPKMSTAFDSVGPV